METLIVSDECVTLGLRAGIILFRDVTVQSASDSLLSEIAAEVEQIRGRFPSVAEIRTAPELAPGQDILRRVGVNPRRQPSSVQNLLQMAVRRGALPTINNFVDSYNLISVRSGCSLGAHDLDRIALPVELRLLRGDESFTPLGSADSKSVTAGEFAYVDAQNRVLCRLDVLQADFSKVTVTTKNVFLIIEGTSAHAYESLKQAYTDCTDLILSECGGEAEIAAFPMIS